MKKSILAVLAALAVVSAGSGVLSAAAAKTDGQPARSDRAAEVAALPRLHPSFEVRTAAPQGVFPVRGAHDFGEAAGRFGAGRGGRSHQGQDVFARTGVPVVAARSGRVREVDNNGGAGNYVVIRGTDGNDTVYMHLARRASVREGQAVTAGQAIGKVGCTGSCWGPHLHFEIWKGRWPKGKAVNPMPQLRRWDRAT